MQEKRVQEMGKVVKTADLRVCFATYSVVFLGVFFRGGVWQLLAVGGGSAAISALPPTPH